MLQEYMMFHSSFSSCISQLLASMGRALAQVQNRSCLGCCVKSLSITAGDASRGLRVQGRPCLSEDFWSTSTYDLDNTTLQPQRSVSSISVPSQSQSQSSSHSEFVNHGLVLWNQSRAQWCGAEKSSNHGKVREPVLSWNASYDTYLLSTSKRFPQTVPLSEMVDFLVDMWDQEGLYD